MLYCAAQGCMADHVSDEKLVHVAIKETIPYTATPLSCEERQLRTQFLKLSFQKML